MRTLRWLKWFHSRIDVHYGHAIVFRLSAPTDDAFAALPAEKLDSWLKPENVGELDQILRYHVWPDIISEDCGGCNTNVADVLTLSGDSVHIHTTNSRTMVNEAYVIGAYSASNGVIQVIDTVLFPHSSKTNHDNSFSTVCTIRLGYTCYSGMVVCLNVLCLVGLLGCIKRFVYRMNHYNSAGTHDDPLLTETA